MRPARSGTIAKMSVAMDVELREAIEALVAAENAHEVSLIASGPYFYLLSGCC